MKLNAAMQAAYQAVVNHAFTSPILLLHPRGRYRSIMVAMLINDDEVKSFYYALGPDDIDIRSFVESLTREVVTQHPTFGRHLNLLPPAVYEDPIGNLDLLVGRFALELSEMSDDDFVFVLDEYDRSDEANDVHTFIEKLADVLPEHCHLVLNGRKLPRLPWLAMAAKKEAILLRDDKLIQTDFYNTQLEGEHDFEVFALGPGIVHHQGARVDTFEGHLPRLLLFFALDKPVVTRAEICSSFWPDLAIDQAVNVFHVTKRRLHKALGVDILIHEGSHYRVNPEFNVYYDILDFVETLIRGRNAENDEAFEHWQAATKLYQGPFLQGHNDAWIVDRREAFRAGYIEALTEMAGAWITKDRGELALKLYLQALDEDYKREDVHRAIMELYSNLGRQSEAIAHYNDLEKAFKSKGLQLSAETLGVYKSIVG